MGITIFGGRVDSRIVREGVVRQKTEDLDLMPLCLMWLIQKEQNNKYFYGVEGLCMFRLKSLFLSSLQSWESRECNLTLDQSFDMIDTFVSIAEVEYSVVHGFS